MEEKIIKSGTEPFEKEWHAFVSAYALSEQQSQQFQLYQELLIQWNKKFNITTILDESDILNYHFKDSLSLVDVLDVSQCKGMVDVGSGGGFPGIPIKIKYPSIPMVLIEVNLKKVTFLREVIAALGLLDITVTDLDWRTFLRTTSYPLDIFLARASLQPGELVRMFKPSSHYGQGQLCYWAAQSWQPDSVVAPYVQKKYSYTLKNKKRQLIFLANQ